MSTASTNLNAHQAAEILGVRVDAAPGVLKRAYAKLARQHHPDKGGDKVCSVSGVGRGRGGSEEGRRGAKRGEEGREGQGQGVYAGRRAQKEGQGRKVAATLTWLC